MGAGSAALIWYACCCSFVAFVGIVGAGLIVYGRQRELRARSLPIRPASDAAAPTSDGASSDEPPAAETSED